MISKQSKLEIPESRTHWANQHSNKEPKCQYGSINVDQHSSREVKKISRTSRYLTRRIVHLINFIRNYL